ncbi:heme-binding protein [Mesorhizobium sp. M1A.F.Ca.ET.072.01.1.1]|uniref:heme-binding protein n=1 Tax=Mesorhizobium sp. M1A.F.Ca.ET.072.01.1.1 TaxID=2496753 RepID=UPI001FE031E2|nr:heme-binding protein [Mesorhizobium sp. M1A.F.Ca.ET.072.01.1.1]
MLVCAADKQTACMQFRAWEIGRMDEIRDQIEAIQRETERHAFSSFSQADALRVGKTLLGLAEGEGLCVAVGVDLGEQVSFRAALPGTSADYQHWIERKFATVRRFAKASMQLELQARLEPDFGTERALDPSRYVLCGGAVPICVGSTMVGAIGCAGLASIDDHRLVIRAIETYRKAIDGS